MNPLYSLHLRRKLPPRPTFVDEVVPVTYTEELPVLVEEVLPEIVNIVAPIDLVEDLHPEDAPVEDPGFEPEPVPEEDLVQDVVIHTPDDNDEIPVIKKKLWNPSQRKAELLHIAQEIGLEVTEENTKDEILEALRSLD